MHIIHSINTSIQKLKLVEISTQVIKKENISNRCSIIINIDSLIHSTAINRTERDLIELKYFEILWKTNIIICHISLKKT